MNLLYIFFFIFKDLDIKSDMIIIKVGIFCWLSDWLAPIAISI